MATPEERLDKIETILECEKRFLKLEGKIEELEKKAGNQLVILGDTLRIPFGGWLALILGIIFLGIFALLWMGLVGAPGGRVSEILATFYHREDGRIVQDKDRRVSVIYTLVTPHEKTIEDLEAKGVKLTEEERKSYTLEPGALEEFGKYVRSAGAQGFSRREVWGEASKPLKRGWEWTITWRSDQEIKVERLVEIYEKLFHRSKGIYIEERHVGKTLFDRK